MRLVMEKVISAAVAIGLVDEFEQHEIIHAAQHDASISTNHYHFQAY